jgi:hypothetical protein
LGLLFSKQNIEIGFAFVGAIASGGDKRPKTKINKGFEDSDRSEKSRAY